MTAFIMKRSQFIDIVSYAKRHFWDIEYDDYGNFVMADCMVSSFGILFFAIFMCHVTTAIHFVRPILGNLNCTIY